jgi:hypothetical protein
VQKYKTAGTSEKSAEAILRAEKIRVKKTRHPVLGAISQTIEGLTERLLPDTLTKDEHKRSGHAEYGGKKGLAAHSPGSATSGRATRSFPYGFGRNG